MVKINLVKKPRIFKVGIKDLIEIKEVAKINLKSNEQVVFVSKKKKYDFVKKNWGYYATPSINGRLKDEGYKAALVKNEVSKIYLMVVDKDKIKVFKKYCKKEKQKIIKWLDEY
jgi:hypothetical protein